MPYRYRQSVLAEIIRHGVKPTEDTPPELVREFINDLYLIEVRALRARLLSGSIAKNVYASRVLELRKRYPILSLPLKFWTTE